MHLYGSLPLGDGLRTFKTHGRSNMALKFAARCRIHRCRNNVRSLPLRNDLVIGKLCFWCKLEQRAFYHAWLSTIDYIYRWECIRRLDCRCKSWVRAMVVLPTVIPRY